MAFIYKIINDINQKIYIGKTSLPIKKRFLQHCQDCYKKTEEKRPLYTAMRKYGIEHFNVEEIEECSADIASEREQYWIKYFQSYSNGYNATKGGDGKLLFSHEQIAFLLSKNPYAKEIAEMIGCSIDTVEIVAKEYNITLQHKKQKYHSKKIAAYTKDGTFIKQFDSTQLASEWCFSQGYCAAMNSGVRGHIADVANGKRRSAYGFLWKYI